jgi:hypothetical protein
MRKFIGIILAVIVFFAVIAVLPIGHNHTNPPVIAEPKWDSPLTRELAQRACYDCHSNETTWPWYSSLNPIAWLVQVDVDNGRRRLNFSEWNRPQRLELNEIAGIVLEGEMPPLQYLLMHPNAKLTNQERQELAQGLQTTLNR